jgi:hypothetical protein
VLSDSSGRVIVVIVVCVFSGNKGLFFGSRSNRFKPTKSVVGDPCESQLADVGDVEGLVEELLLIC